MGFDVFLPLEGMLEKPPGSHNVKHIPSDVEKIQKQLKAFWGKFSAIEKRLKELETRISPLELDRSVRDLKAYCEDKGNDHCNHINK